MMRYDDLYTDSKNTPQVYSIKKHIEVIAPVQYTKPPVEVTFIVYAVAILFLGLAVRDAIFIVKQLLGVKQNVYRRNSKRIN